MSTIACWATNKSFDCAWVYYGYGSRHDMMRSNGYWLSLEGICILAEYDYDYYPTKARLCMTKPRDRILIDKLGVEPNDYNGYDTPPERFHEIPEEIIMEASAITIQHPDGMEKSLEWFREACKASGQYPKKQYKEMVIHQNCSEQFSSFNWNLPSMKSIKEINPYHYECHQNVELRDKICIESLEIEKKWQEQWGGWHTTTNKDIELMLEQWEVEAEEAHEEFKKKNIWSLL